MFVIRLIFLLVISKHKCLMLTEEQRRLDRMDLMKALDNVTGNRKNTHFRLPISIVDPSKPLNLHSDDTANIPYYGQRNVNTQKTDKKIQNEINNFKDTGEKKNENEFNPTKKGESEFDWHTFMINQNKIIMKLTRVLVKRNALRQSEFRSLEGDLPLVDPKYDVKEVTMSLDNVRPNKVMTIDETMIRSALKADPLIQRILKIGRKKRNDYLREMNKS